MLPFRSRLVMAALLFALTAPVSAFGQGGVLRVGLPSLPGEVVPATALEGPISLISRQAFDTLVQYTEGSSDIEAGLAAQWAVSRDGLVWSFRLRSGVTFQDGTALTAAHVVQSLEREIFPGQSPSGAEPSVAPRLLRGMPGVVKEIRAPDARTVEIVLLQPYAPLLTVLAHPAFSIVLPTTSGTAGGNRWQGTGPFSIVEIVPGRITLDARSSHWRGAPRVGRIVFTEASDATQAQAALDGQELDLYFPAGAPPRQGGSMFVSSWRIGYVALQTEKEPFRRAKARRAVAAALDPGLIAAALGPFASPLQAFLPGGVWSRRDGPPLMGADAERAKRLLVESGLAAGTPVTFLVSEGGQRIAEAISAALGASGFTVTAQSESRDAARALLQAGDYQIALEEAFVAAGDPHFWLFPLSTSEGATKGATATNFSFYRESRLDDLLIRASQLSFRPERERLYVRAQAMLAESLPWIPIYVRLQWAVARPEVKNLRLHPSGNPRLERVSLEPAGVRPASAAPPSPSAAPPSR